VSVWIVKKAMQFLSIYVAEKPHKIVERAEIELYLLAHKMPVHRDDCLVRVKIDLFWHRYSM